MSALKQLSLELRPSSDGGLACRTKLPPKKKVQFDSEKWFENVKKDFIQGNTIRNISEKISPSLSPLKNISGMGGGGGVVYFEAPRGRNFVRPGGGLFYTPPTPRRVF